MTGPGTTVAGRYDVVRQLGSGSMGSVWLARDTSLGREVAVKSVRGPLVDDHGGTGGEQRALREARMIARVNHPYAVAIYDVVMHEGHPWLVMEYVRSQNLAELVHERGPISPRRAAEIGSQVAAALAEVHRAGIVHRDVKPANVLIAEHGGAKITDFGIARGDGDVTLTATGTIWGTPAYFAPEVAAGANPTPKADVWSLGASLYYAVEGTPPHGTDTSPLVLLGRIANQPVPAPTKAGALGPVLARLLERDPEHRPTMAQAADMLAAGQLPGAEQATVSAPWRPPVASTGDGHFAPTSAHGGLRNEDVAAARAGHRRRRRGGLLAVLAVVALLAVGVVAWLQLATGDTDRSSVPQQPGPTEPVQSDAPAPTPTPSESPPSPSPSETQPESQPPSSPVQEGETAAPSDPFTPSAIQQTIAGYYAIMPEDTDAGFELLGPTLQSRGFEAYDDFWDGIESVSVSNIEPDPADRSATATVVFVTEDGTTSTETHQFGLVPDEEGDGLLINTDSVVS